MSEETNQSEGTFIGLFNLYTANSIKLVFSKV